MKTTIPYLKYAKSINEKAELGMFIDEFESLIKNEIKKDYPDYENDEFMLGVIFDNAVEIAAETE